MNGGIIFVPPQLSSSSPQKKSIPRRRWLPSSYLAYKLQKKRGRREREREEGASFVPSFVRSDLSPVPSRGTLSERRYFLAKDVIKINVITNELVAGGGSAGGVTAKGREKSQKVSVELRLTKRELIFTNHIIREQQQQYIEMFLPRLLYRVG